MYYRMHKIIALLLLVPAMWLGKAEAQFRKIPGEVTDAFRKQYPNASGASWTDKLSYFQVDFKLDSAVYLARYDKAGAWKSSERSINADQLPAQVKDGYDKSMYTDTWKAEEYKVMYSPGNKMWYRILVKKGGIQRKYLYFNETGKMTDGPPSTK